MIVNCRRSGNAGRAVAAAAALGYRDVALAAQELPGDRAFRLEESIAAVAEFEVRSGREARLPGRDVYSTSGCVLSEQGSLGTTQNLDAFYVQKVRGRGCRTRVINTVDVESDTGLNAIVG